MKELQELKESSNEVIKQSNELLDYLEENLADYERIEQERDKLQHQHEQFYKLSMLLVSAAGLHSLLILGKIIMTVLI